MLVTGFRFVYARRKSPLIPKGARDESHCVFNRTACTRVCADVRCGAIQSPRVRLVSVRKRVSGHEFTRATAAERKTEHGRHVGTSAPGRCHKPKGCSGLYRGASIYGVGQAAVGVL